MRLLEGLGPSQQRLTVSPPVLFPQVIALTGDGDDAEGCIPVLILVLEDLYQYHYVYEILVRAQRTFPLSRTFATFVGMMTDAPEHDALAPWFGPAGTDGRKAIIAEMESFAALELSDIQNGVLLKWHGDVTFLNSPPGGGKTFLMETIIVFLLQTYPDATFVVTLRTHALADQLAARLAVVTRRNKLEEAVAQVGYDKENDVEHFNRAISKRAVSHCGAHLRLLDICDATINLVQRLDGKPAAVVVRILRLRCELWEDLQYLIQRQTDLASGKIRLVIATTTFFLKVQAGHVP